jgi:hypothetical protein
VRSGRVLVYLCIDLQVGWQMAPVANRNSAVDETARNLQVGRVVCLVLPVKGGFPLDWP